MYAKFATEVKSIEEQVNLKQAMADSPYSGFLNDLLDNESIYNDKILVEDGNLKYISSNSSSQEIEWFEKLGVKKASDYYTIDFDTFDETQKIESQSIRVGKLVKQPTTPIKEGYKFLGWYFLEEKGSGDNISYEEKKFDFTTKIMRNYSLYAKYSGEAVMKAYTENEDFWNYKTEITSISFEKGTIPSNLPTLSWNIEESDECSSIVAYLENDNSIGGYKLTIISPLTIYANADTKCYFDGFTSLISIDFSNFNTSKSRTMHWMFRNCESLKNIDLSKFDTNNVTSMYGMFYNCKTLEKLDLSSFNTKNVTDMAGMFGICQNITDLDLSNFNTSNVHKMHNMFGACIKLENVNLSSFDTQNVDSMGTMFWNCKSLKYLNISNFNTSNVTNMSRMFRACSELTTLDISNFDTTKVETMEGIFSYTINLSTIYVGDNWTTENIDITDMFTGCKTNEVTIKTK